MKKLFFLAACSAVVLSSCSNEIEQCSSNATLNSKAITVSTYTPGLTRATVADEAALEANGFFMYAVTEGETFINTMYTYLDDSWNAADGETYNWPETSVDFYGVYVPGMTAEDAPSYIEDGVVTLSDLGSSDVMVASATGLSLAENGQNVGLEFNHILADVEIQVIGMSEGYDYTVYGVSLEAYNACTYDLAADRMEATGEPNSFVLNEQVTTWAEGATVLDKEASAETALTVGTEEALVIDESKMVVPGQVSLYISYAITTGSTVVTEYLNREVSVEGEVAAGTKTILLVKLTPGQLPIVVSTTVNEWDETTVDKELAE